MDVTHSVSALNKPSLLSNRTLLILQAVMNLAEEEKITHLPGAVAFHWSKSGRGGIIAGTCLA
jgi:hypothetical protein